MSPNDYQWESVSEPEAVTGINRVTLSKMVNHRGYSTVTDNIDQLCKFFDCKVGDVMEYVDGDVDGNVDR